MTMPMLDIAQDARAQVSQDLYTLLASTATSPTTTRGLLKLSWRLNGLRLTGVGK